MKKLNKHTVTLATTLLLSMGMLLSGNAFAKDDALKDFVTQTELDTAIDDIQLTPGPQGPAGADSTVAGPTGPQGEVGPAGADSTVAGPTGPQGEVGPAGADSTVAGPAGPQGEVGPAGADSTVAGPAGPQGEVGPAGADSTVAGPAGPQGEVGPAGADSTVAGPAGPQGEVGPAGADSTVAGPAGPQGDVGPAGADSTVAGPAGPQGDVGPAGADSTVAGPAGPQGDVGPAGPQGEIGSVGERGPIGQTGFDGADGTSISDGTENGDVLTWEAINGGSWIASQPSIPKLRTILSSHEDDDVSNMQPFSAISYIIALQGFYPGRNGSDPFLGEIAMFAGNFAPRGWAFCNGQILPIEQNTNLFSLLGTTYGGDGRTTFALPDLRGRAPIHAGTGTGLTERRLGSRGGSEILQ